MGHPTVHPQTPHVAVDSTCVLGEGPVWDHRVNRLIWVDIKDPGVWTLDPASGKHEKLAVPERIGFVALTPDPDVVIGGFKTGLKRLNLKSGACDLIVDPEAGMHNNRINDGIVGPDGRLYFGTMHDGEEHPEGSFYRFDGKNLHKFREGFVVTNGPALSPDGRLIYTTDTMQGIVYVQDADGEDLSEPRHFVTFESGWGHPDGMAVDAEGHVWVCHWGGSRITRFTPDGTAERTLPVPTAQVTKCAFGGPNMTTLYITTAGINRDPSLDPMAGHLFKVETGIKGQLTNIFEG